MNIIIGKKVLTAAAVLMILTLPGVETVLYKEDFEETLPGAAPVKWRKIWGDNATDTFTVSNEKSSKGDQALLLERTDHIGQWGFGVPFQQPEKGVLAVSFDFLLEGPGNQACIGFEVRQSISGRSVYSAFTVADFKIRDGKRKKLLDLTGDTWYHVVFQMPLTPADGDTRTIEISELKNPENRAVIESPVTEYPTKLGSLTINTQPQKNHFRAFFDDVVIKVTDPD